MIDLTIDEFTIKTMNQEINLVQISTQLTDDAIKDQIKQTSEQTLAFVHMQVETSKAIDELVRNMVDAMIEKEQSEGVKVIISESLDDAFFENAFNLASGDVFETLLRESL